MDQQPQEYDRSVFQAVEEGKEVKRFSSLQLDRVGELGGVQAELCVRPPCEQLYAKGILSEQSKEGSWFL